MIQTRPRALPGRVIGVLRVIGALFAMGATDLAAAMSPGDLVDRATLRIDAGMHHGRVTAVAATADGRVLATAGMDRAIRLWDAQTGDPVRTIWPPSQDTAAEGQIHALAFSPDGRFLAAAGVTRFWDRPEGRGSGTYLIDVGTGRLTTRLPGVPDMQYDDTVHRLGFAKSGTTLWALSGHAPDYTSYSTLQRYDNATDGKPKARLLADGSYVDLDVDGNGRLLALRSRIVRWLDGMGQPGAQIAMPAGEGGVYVSARVSPDGSRVALLLSNAGAIELRDGKTLAPIARIATVSEEGERPHSIEWARDGKSLLLVSNIDGGTDFAGLVRRVQIDGKKLSLRPLWRQSAVVTGMTALPDGALAIGSADATLVVVTAAGQVRWQKASGSVRVKDAADLWTDASGGRIWLRTGPGAQGGFRFSVPEPSDGPRLQWGAKPEEGLQGPRVEIPPPHSLSGWRNGRLVMLDSGALPTQREPSSAMAVAPDNGSFVLGLRTRLQKYLFHRAGDRTGCPEAPRPGSELALPCFDVLVPAPVLAVNYAGGGQVIVAALADGSVRWYRATDGRERLALFVHADRRRYVAWQPDGVNMASIGGGALVGWLVNHSLPAASSLFPLERFRAKLDRPDALVAVLRPDSGLGRIGGRGEPTAGEDPEPALPEPEVPAVEEPPQPKPGQPLVPRKPPQPMQPPAPKPRHVSDPASGRAGTELRGMLPPVATILAPSDGMTVSDGQVTLRVLVHSPVKQQIRGVRVLVNGRLDPKARGVVDLTAEPGVDAVGSGVEVHSIPVLLPKGESSIAVFAEGTAGASVPAVIRLRSSATGQSAAAGLDRKPRLVVLAVGVGDYARAELRLNYPAKDARDLLAVLQAQRSKLYSDVLSRVLVDGEATLEGIRQGLQWLGATVQPDDTALIFLAGHGVNDAGNGQYLFLPRDADLQSLGRTTLPATEIQQVLTALQTRVLLLLDTCHSGNVMPGRGTRGVGGDITRFVGDLASVEQGIVVMAASTGRQASQESAQWENGAFTRALVEGLRGGADFRKTGRVTINMLDLYVSERVRELTDGMQTPATAKPVTIPDFPLVTLP